MKRVLLVLTTVWFLIIGISLVWNLEHSKRDHEQIALQAARSFFRQIVLPRRWNAAHGGIYAVVTEEVQPNPHLKAPLRDVVTTGGLELTMLNPASMMRQIAEIAAQEENILFHITSSKLINPANKATAWETEWLKSFEQGEVERFAIIHQKSGDKFRYMAPLCIDENCLKCHAEQGYKKGDIRGGISVTLPFFEKSTSPLWVGHGATALIGLAGILLAGSLLGHGRRNLIESNKQLEKEVSEHKQAEEGLRQAEREWDNTFNAMNDFVSVHDNDHRLVKVNKALADYFGKKKEELIGKHCYELFHGLDEPWSGCPHSTALELKTAVTAEVDDQHFGCPLLVTTSPVYDENGVLRGTVHIAKDITERKKAEKEQRELLAKLQQSQKMEAIGTLAGGIAHDFNNILTAIIGYSELSLIKMDNKESLRKYIGGVMTGAERARALVSQILTFSRITDEEKHPLLVSPLVIEALKLLRSSIPTTIDIKQDITSQGVVVADSSQIHQIVMNLCTNAYYAMRETGGTLGITMKDIELSDLRAASQLDLAPGKYIHLEITDTGIGIDAKIKEKIFDPYFTTKEVGEGTGLGLAVVHAVVQNHNGRIIVCSEPGEGTTFHIYFPIAEGEKAVDMQKDQETPLTGGDEIIMLVDDEKTSVELTKEILTMHGYTVFTFTNGVQAFQELQEELDKYDLVITDMTMPYMTGTQLSQKILAIRPSLPIILCTGYSELTNREKALAMGIKEYCQKPLRIHALLGTVRKVLDKAKIKDA